MAHLKKESKPRDGERASFKRKKRRLDGRSDEQRC